MSPTEADYDISCMTEKKKSLARGRLLAPLSDTYTSIIKKNKKNKLHDCTWRWSSGQRVWLGNERFEFDAY